VFGSGGRGCRGKTEIGLRRKSLVGWLAAISFIVGVSGMGMLLADGAASASPAITYVRGSGPHCSVQLDVGATSATAVVESGCAGRDYWFSVWNAKSDVYRTSFPQQLSSSTNRAPWTLQLPQSAACDFQLDFSMRSAPPGQHAAVHDVIAGYLGHCASTLSTGGGPPTTVSTDPGPKPASHPTPPVSQVVETDTPGGATQSTTTIGLGPTAFVPGTSYQAVPSTRPSNKPQARPTTTTTTPAVTGAVASTGPPGGGSPVRLSSLGPTSPARAANSKSSPDLPFTIFAVLMLLFASLTAVGCRSAISRANRSGSTIAWGSRSGNP
jgi:hypothetical protein